MSQGKEESSIHTPIETPIGILTGRDAIYLDKFEFDSFNLTLTGSFNGHLASNTTERWIEYELTFFGVLALKLIELDSWDFKCASSFDEVLNSEWQAKLGGKVSQRHKHYFFQAYDEVIEVICNSYALTCGKK